MHVGSVIFVTKGCYGLDAFQPAIFRLWDTRGLC